MTYNLKVGEGTQVSFKCLSAIEKGELVIGRTGYDDIEPASAAGDALGVSAAAGYTSATPDYEDQTSAPTTRYQYVTVYMSGVIYFPVHADGSDVDIGDDLEIESSVLLKNAGGTNPVVAQALEYVANGETESIKVRLHRKKS